MGLFDNMLKDNETLFSNQSALEYEFVPKLIPYRENEQHRMASCIKPLFQERNGKNLIIVGKPGVGKTVACRHVLKEIDEKYEDEIKTLYVNCWKHNTTYKVVVQLCELMDYKFTQNKKTEELFKILSKKLNEKACVFVFDELDKADDLDFLYMILEEIFKKSIILITNYKEFVLEIEDRIKSRLIPEMMDFMPYTQGETKGILSDRKKLAFYEGVWVDEAFTSVVKKTYEAGDIRAGLYLMKETATIAEDASSKKILLKHYEKAEKKIDDFFIKSKDSLPEDEKFILEIIKKNSGQKIGDVYKIFQNEGGQSAYKSFKRRITKLAEDRFITTQKVTGGPEGSTTIITYKKDSAKKITDF